MTIGSRLVLLAAFFPLGSSGFGESARSRTAVGVGTTAVGPQRAALAEDLVVGSVGSVATGGTPGSSKAVHSSASSSSSRESLASTRSLSSKRKPKARRRNHGRWTARRAVRRKARRHGGRGANAELWPVAEVDGANSNYYGPSGGDTKKWSKAPGSAPRKSSSSPGSSATSSSSDGTAAPETETSFEASCLSYVEAIPLEDWAAIEYYFLGMTEVLAERLYERESSTSPGRTASSEEEIVGASRFFGAAVAQLVTDFFPGSMGPPAAEDRDPHDCGEWDPPGHSFMSAQSAQSGLLRETAAVSEEGCESFRRRKASEEEKFRKALGAFAQRSRTCVPKIALLLALLVDGTFRGSPHFRSAAGIEELQEANSLLALFFDVVRRFDVFAEENTTVASWLLRGRKEDEGQGEERLGVSDRAETNDSQEHEFLLVTAALRSVSQSMDVLRDFLVSVRRPVGLGPHRGASGKPDPSFFESDFWGLQRLVVYAHHRAVDDKARGADATETSLRTVITAVPAEEDNFQPRQNISCDAHFAEIFHDSTLHKNQNQNGPETLPREAAGAGERPEPSPRGEETEGHQHPSPSDGAGYSRRTSGGEVDVGGPQLLRYVEGLRELLSADGSLLQPGLLGDGVVPPPASFGPSFWPRESWRARVLATSHFIAGRPERFAVARFEGAAAVRALRFRGLPAGAGETARLAVVGAPGEGEGNTNNTNSVSKCSAGNSSASDSSASPCSASHSFAGWARPTVLWRMAGVSQSADLALAETGARSDTNSTVGTLLLQPLFARVPSSRTLLWAGTAEASSEELELKKKTTKSRATAKETGEGESFPNEGGSGEGFPPAAPSVAHHDVMIDVPITVAVQDAGGECVSAGETGAPRGTAYHSAARRDSRSAQWTRRLREIFGVTGRLLDEEASRKHLHEQPRLSVLDGRGNASSLAAAEDAARVRSAYQGGAFFRARVWDDGGVDADPDAAHQEGRVPYLEGTEGDAESEREEEEEEESVFGDATSGRSDDEGLRHITIYSAAAEGEETVENRRKIDQENAQPRVVPMIHRENQKVPRESTSREYGAAKVISASEQRQHGIEFGVRPPSAARSRSVRRLVDEELDFVPHPLYILAVAVSAEHMYAVEVDGGRYELALALLDLALDVSRRRFRVRVITMLGLDEERREKRQEGVVREEDEEVLVSYPELLASCVQVVQLSAGHSVEASVVSSRGASSASSWKTTEEEDFETFECGGFAPYFALLERARARLLALNRVALLAQEDVERQITMSSDSRLGVDREEVPQKNSMELLEEDARKNPTSQTMNHYQIDTTVLGAFATYLTESDDGAARSLAPHLKAAARQLGRASRDLQGLRLILTSNSRAKGDDGSEELAALRGLLWDRGTGAKKDPKAGMRPSLKSSDSWLGGRYSAALIEFLYAEAVVGSSAVVDRSRFLEGRGGLSSAARRKRGRRSPLQHIANFMRFGLVSAAGIISPAGPGNSVSRGQRGANDDLRCADCLDRKLLVSENAGWARDGKETVLERIFGLIGLGSLVELATPVESPPATSARYFVEIGSRLLHEGSMRYFKAFRGFDGLWLDASAHFPAQNLHSALATPENVVELVERDVYERRRARLRALGRVVVPRGAVLDDEVPRTEISDKYLTPHYPFEFDCLASGKNWHILRAVLQSGRLYPRVIVVEYVHDDELFPDGSFDDHYAVPRLRVSSSSAGAEEARRRAEEGTRSVDSYEKSLPPQNISIWESAEKFFGRDGKNDQQPGRAGPGLPFVALVDLFGYDLVYRGATDLVFVARNATDWLLRPGEVGREVVPRAERNTTARTEKNTGVFSAPEESGAKKSKSGSSFGIVNKRESSREAFFDRYDSRHRRYPTRIPHFVDEGAALASLTPAEYYYETKNRRLDDFAPLSDELLPTKRKARLRRLFHSLCKKYGSTLRAQRRSGAPAENNSSSREGPSGSSPWTCAAWGRRTGASSSGRSLNNSRRLEERFWLEMTPRMMVERNGGML